MILEFLTTTHGRRSFVNRSDSIAAILLIVANVLGNSINNSPVAGTSLLGIFFLFVVLRSQSTNWCRGLIEVVLGFILFGYLIQIAGEVAGSWVTNYWSITAILTGLLATALQRSPVPVATRRTVVNTAVLTCVGGALWIFLLSLRPSTLVNFLGYGYDNAAHIAQTKMILGHHGTTLLAGGMSSWPSFIQDSAQAGSSFMATMFTLMGNQTADSPSLLSVFALITLALPILSVLIPVTAVAVLKERRFTTFVSCIALLVIFGTGYLSRIWFSGYLASNLATMLTILLVTVIVSGQFDKPLLPMAIVLTIAHVYPIFIVIAGILVLPTLVTAIDSVRRNGEPFATKFPPLHLTVIAALIALLLLPARATGRSFGGSHFLTDGGIEYLPSRFLLVWGLPFVVLPSIFLAMTIRRFAALFVCTSSLLLSLAVCAYSISEMHRITYYPTKFVIALVLSGIAAVVVEAAKLGKLRLNRYAVATMIIATLTFSLLTPSSRVFTSAYMGEAPRVLSAAKDFNVEVVPAEQIVQLATLSNETSKPILYSSWQHESELNSRWINTLSSSWNDNSWSTWITLRTAIESGDTEMASKILSGHEVILATDRSDLYAALSIMNPTKVCLFSTTEVCEFS